MAKQQSKRIEEKFHFHSSLPCPEMSNHKIFYKYKLKHQNLEKAPPPVESFPKEQSTKKTSTETSTNKHEQPISKTELNGIAKQKEEVKAEKV
jgi:hypothetical protein